MTEMQAVRLHRTGGAEALSVESVPVPEPGPGEVLLRLKAASVNHLDIWLREGMLPVPLPHVPGCDGAGEVAALGPGVTGIAPGDRYLIWPGLACGHCAQCAAGRQNYCAGFGIFGAQCPGTYAEYQVVPAGSLVPMPDSLDFSAAATLGVAGLTPWHLLVTRGGVRPGHTVLVRGAGSGVGMFAIRIARRFGARVLATAGSPEKMEKGRELGADEVFSHHEPVAERVREATGGQGVDLVFDHVGAEAFSDNVACLAIGGKLLTCGTTTGADVALGLRDLFSGQREVIGGRLGGVAELHRLTREVASGAVVPVIDSVFPLAQAEAAHRLMDGRGQFGKILLTMA